MPFNLISASVMVLLNLQNRFLCSRVLILIDKNFFQLHIITSDSSHNQSIFYKFLCPEYFFSSFVIQIHLDIDFQNNKQFFYFWNFESPLFNRVNKLPYLILTVCILLVFSMPCRPSKKVNDMIYVETFRITLFELQH